MSGMLCFGRETTVAELDQTAEYRSVLTLTLWQGTRYLGHLFMGLERVR